MEGGEEEREETFREAHSQANDSMTFQNTISCIRCETMNIHRYNKLKAEATWHHMTYHF